jgi:hypothetical protein
VLWHLRSGAAHSHSNAPFDINACVSAVLGGLESWRTCTSDSNASDATGASSPRGAISNAQLCYCVQPKDHKKETDVYDIVTEVQRERLPDWHEIPWAKNGMHAFNLLWSWSNPHKGKGAVDVSKLLLWQRVNRFPNSRPLTRKDELKRNLSRYAKMPGNLGAAFDCFPETFNLPSDYKGWLAEYQRIQAVEEDGEAESGNNIWIMKPVGSSRGRGIFLVSDLNDVSYSESMVVQRYITNPLLINGFKFDLRLYVCVLSFQPLRAYIHRRGFARFSSEK